MKKVFLSAVFLVAAAVYASGSVLIGYAEDGDSAYSFNNEDAMTFTIEDAVYSEDLSVQAEPYSNYSSDSYLYRDFLDGNNLAVYDALSEWVTPSEEEITVKLPDTITVSLSGLPGTSSYTEEDAETLSSAVFSNCKSGMDSVFFDMPEIFWINYNNLSINFGDASYSYSPRTKKYTLNISSLKFIPKVLDDLGDVETALEYKDKLEAAVADFTVEGETRYEQIKSIHDQISLFTYYDVDAPFSGTVLGAFVEPGAVCEGYSKGFKMICDKLGIPCVIVFGNYDLTKNTAHMWNYVQMEDGKWYAVDLTWDDLDGGDGQEIKYQYLLSGSESFFVNHTEESNYAGAVFTYPELSASDYKTVEVVEPTTEPESTTGEVKINGDYNDDGSVNAADMIICSRNLIGRDNSCFCDFNGDGNFDSFDLTAMRIYLIDNLNQTV